MLIIATLSICAGSIKQPKRIPNPNPATLCIRVGSIKRPKRIPNSNPATLCIRVGSIKRSKRIPNHMPNSNPATFNFVVHQKRGTGFFRFFLLLLMN